MRHTSPPSSSDRQNAYSMFQHLDVDGDQRISAWELARFFPSVSIALRMHGAFPTYLYNVSGGVATQPSE